MDAWAAYSPHAAVCFLLPVSRAPYELVHLRAPEHNKHSEKLSSSFTRKGQKCAGRKRRDSRVSVTQCGHTVTL